VNDPLVVSRTNLGRLEQIGRGMTAKVYRAPEYTLPGESFPIVYKEYKRGVVPAGAMTGLLAIVRVRDKMAPQQRDALDRRATWPLRVVEDSGHVTGILMRLIPPEFFGTRRARDGSPKAQAMELQFLLQDREFVERIGLEYLNNGQRAAVMRDFAYVLAMLHKVNVVYGDISLLNTIYRGGGKPGAMLVDCDAVRLAGTSSPFIKQPHSPDFDPPEALAHGKHLWTVQSSRTDVYKFGLVFLRVFSVGVPLTSTLRQATSLGTSFPRPVTLMLERTLSPQAAERPTMRDWVDLLAGRPLPDSSAPLRRASTAEQNEPADSQPGAQLPPSTLKQIGRWARQADGSWKRTTEPA
jgi:hypothetical protein